jgi:hypothetical protein
MVYKSMVLLLRELSAFREPAMQPHSSRFDFICFAPLKMDDMTGLYNFFQ